MYAVLGAIGLVLKQDPDEIKHFLLLKMLLTSIKFAVNWKQKNFTGQLLPCSYLEGEYCVNHGSHWGN